MGTICRGQSKRTTRHTRDERSLPPPARVADAPLRVLEAHFPDDGTVAKHPQRRARGQSQRLSGHHQAVVCRGCGSAAITWCHYRTTGGGGERRCAGFVALGCDSRHEGRQHSRTAHIERGCQRRVGAAGCEQARSCQKTQKKTVTSTYNTIAFLEPS